MRRILLVLAYLAVGSGSGWLQAQTGGLIWHESLTEARSQAQRDGRPILVFVTFSGADEEDIRLRSDVFSDPIFLKFSSRNLVLAEVDFSPAGSPTLQEKQTKRRIAQRLKVTSFPSLVLVDGQAGRIVPVDHARISAEQLIEKIRAAYAGG